MIGQHKLVEKLKNVKLNTLSHSIMLVGPKGCGKHLFCKQLSINLNIPMVNISEMLTLETISQIYDSKLPQLYVIDGDRITVKEEGVILKFLEEPSKNAYIVILCTNKGKMLNTILNRCVIWDFDPYTREELCSVSNNVTDELLLVAKTPGNIIKWQNQPVHDVLVLCENILTRMRNASVQNALTLPNKIAFKDGDAGYDRDLFIEALRYVARKKVLENKEHLWYNIYVMTNTFLNDLDIPHIDATKLFENYIVNLKMLLKNENT